MQNNITERNKLLTIGEASEYLGISIDTLRRWEKKGRVEPLRSPGEHRYYKKEDLDNLFGKRYVRDEPTIRESFKKEETLEPEGILSEPIIDKEVNVENKKTTEQEPKEEIISFEEQVEINLRSTDYQPETGDFSNIIDRPPREINIPENTRLRVTKEVLFVSPEEAYMRQQNVSVITPSRENSSQTINYQNTPNTDFFLNRKTIIYGSILIGAILLSLGWYYLWLSSQQVLSPVP